MNADEKIAALIRNPFPEADLTPREREVVRLVTHGHSQRDVAEILDVTRSTINTLVTRASKTIGEKSSLWTLMLIENIYTLAIDQPQPDEWFTPPAERNADQ